MNARLVLRRMWTLRLLRDEAQIEATARTSGSNPRAPPVGSERKSLPSRCASREYSPSLSCVAREGGMSRGGGPEHCINRAMLNIAWALSRGCGESNRSGWIWMLPRAAPLAACIRAERCPSHSCAPGERKAIDACTIMPKKAVRLQSISQRLSRRVLQAPPYSSAPSVSAPQHVPVVRVPSTHRAGESWLFLV